MSGLGVKENTIVVLFVRRWYREMVTELPGIGTSRHYHRGRHSSAIEHTWNSPRKGRKLHTMTLTWQKKMTEAKDVRVKPIFLGTHGWYQELE